MTARRGHILGHKVGLSSGSKVFIYKVANVPRSVFYPSLSRHKYEKQVREAAIVVVVVVPLLLSLLSLVLLGHVALKMKPFVVTFRCKHTHVSSNCGLCLHYQWTNKGLLLIPNCSGPKYRLQLKTFLF